MWSNFKPFSFHTWLTPNTVMALRNSKLLTFPQRVHKVPPNVYPCSLAWAHLHILYYIVYTWYTVAAQIKKSSDWRGNEGPVQDTQENAINCIKIFLFDLKRHTDRHILFSFLLLTGHWPATVSFFKNLPLMISGQITGPAGYKTTHELFMDYLKVYILYIL